jgi:hypothetical protein
MALTNITAARIIDAMESSLVPRNANLLKNKVVHADIRVQGIEDDTNGQEEDAASVQLVEQPNPSSQDIDDQESAEKMRMWWNNEMRKHMNQPEGYAKVAVLLIKWADELDDIKTKDEVSLSKTR